MAAPSYFLQKFTPPSSSTLLSAKPQQSLISKYPNFFLCSTNLTQEFLQSSSYLNSLVNHRISRSYTRIRSRRTFLEEEEENDLCCFEDAVELFNNREYYKCHDILEALWFQSQEPSRSLLHGVLQCAVGFHHLFNQNHRGAMMELGEGICKLRKLNFQTGPFHQFEKEVASVLDFIYETQLEYAACTDDICMTMDQSEKSYQLLGGYGAGQPLYSLDYKQDGSSFIIFCSDRSLPSRESRRIKLPVLHASEDHFF